jgi:hypothetical protein
MGEKETEKCLLIISINNPNRLRSENTEDYYLVDVNNYREALKLLKETEQYVRDMSIVIEDTNAIKRVLDRENINSEYVIDGRRFYFSNESETEWKSGERRDT